jgi:hypothetical protein
MFTMPIQEGDWVSDERVNVSYTVGELLIEVDGFIFETARPLGPDAAMHLPKILIAAEDIAPIPAREATMQPASRSFLSTPLGAATAGGAAFIVVLAVLSRPPRSWVRRQA